MSEPISIDDFYKENALPEEFDEIFYANKYDVKEFFIV